MKHKILSIITGLFALACLLFAFYWNIHENVCEEVFYSLLTVVLYANAILFARDLEGK